MARARNIKPGFFANEDLAECDPLARLLFAGLWCLADREGRLEDRPKRIRAEILPYDMCDAEDLLNQLQDRGFILRYSHGEGRFIQVLKFNSHQNPHMKEAKSSIPAPGESVQTPVTSVAAPEEHQTSTVQAPNQNQKSPAESGSLIPDSLIPDSKGETAPRKRAATFPVPDWINREHWDAWHSCKKRKNATDAQKQMAVDKLDAWRHEGVDHAAALENAAIGGWQGLFKPDERGHVQATGETAYQRSMRERMQEAAPDIARRSPTAPQQDATDFFRTVDAPSRVVDIKAIEVTQ